MSLTLHECAAKGKEKKLKKLIDFGADVNTTNEDGETALYYAALHSKDQCLKLLLKNGADPNIVSKQGFTAVDAAKSKNHSKTLKILLQNGGILFTENERMVLKRINSIQDVKISRSIQSIPGILEEDLKGVGDSSSFLICFGRMMLKHAFWYNHPITIKSLTNYQRTSSRETKNDEDFLQNELKILSNLRHPNVIKLLATSVTKSMDSMMLIFEPIKINIADAIYKENEKFDDDYVYYILLEMARATEFIHQKGILHNFINSQSIYRCENKIVLGNFIYAQKSGQNNKSISFITSQLPWMAPMQANGEIPDRFSDIYSFGALTWELLAKRQPRHWTSLDEATDDDNAFSFPLEENWNSNLKNIISFCVQTTSECRPELATIIEFLQKEITIISEADHGEASTNNVLKNVKEGTEHQFKRLKTFTKSLEMMKNNFHSTVAWMSNVENKDFKKLHKKLSNNTLTIVKANRMMNLARRHQRQVWAKESINIKDAEKIYLSRNISHEKKDAAKQILNWYAYPFSDGDKLHNIPRCKRFTTKATNNISTTQNRTTKLLITEKRIRNMKKLLVHHQRKRWSKVATYERTCT